MNHVNHRALRHARGDDLSKSPGTHPREPVVLTDGLAHDILTSTRRCKQRAARLINPPTTIDKGKHR